MKTISSGVNKVTQEQHLKLLERWELGPFKKWELDINRLKEIENNVHEYYKQVVRPEKYDRKTAGTGKNQRARELEKLKDEIDNI